MLIMLRSKPIVRLSMVMLSCGSEEGNGVECRLAKQIRGDGTDNRYLAEVRNLSAISSFEIQPASSRRAPSMFSIRSRR